MGLRSQPKTNLAISDVERSVEFTSEHLTKNKQRPCSFDFSTCFVPVSDLPLGGATSSDIMATPHFAAGSIDWINRRGLQGGASRHDSLSIQVQHIRRCSVCILASRPSHPSG
eukprot:GHVN01064160.1.p1 GENE.GHVN01064160.1~~GHVN01064160.1.p1  ORF type:complete len:113 (-),score=14.89 GHVN01064160.1:151-489(-)